MTLSYGVFFSGFAAVLTAMWALFIHSASIRTIAAAILISIPVLIITLSVPTAAKDDPETKVDWPMAFLLALIFFLYQSAFYLGITADGALSQAVVNANVVIIAVYTMSTKPSPLNADDLSVACASVLYVALAFYIAYARPKNDN